jgi:hypothetical membrane protein
MTQHRLKKAFFFTCWLPALALVQALCLAMAWRTYPHYSMYRNEISDLGVPRHNPAGWWYWALAMGLAGLMLVPVTNYLFQQMQKRTARRARWLGKLVRLSCVASRCATFGLIALALIPQYKTLDPLHQIAGVFAFGGLYLAQILLCATLWGLPLNRPQIVLATVGILWGPIGFLATQGFRCLVYGEIGDPIKVRNQSLLLRFPLWEWMLYFCLITSLILLVLLLSDGIAPENARKR